MTNHRRKNWFWPITVGATWALFITASLVAEPPLDPGPRGGAPGAGGPIAGLTVKEGKFFDAGLDEFEEVASADGSVPDTEEGLGPRFNLTGCATCHAHPAVGGTSPANNPQTDTSINPADTLQISTLIGLNILSPTGPVREVRFSTDGGVHDLFTIKGLPGAPIACDGVEQPNFAAAKGDGIVRFRIPTPTFGLGLIEALEDATILTREGPQLYGISGKANRNGNDGTVTRFGWKAQNKSLVIFSGEAYNVESGITNALFPDERDDAGGTPTSAFSDCAHVVTAPQDTVHFELTQPNKVIDDVSNFANFMRFLAPPVQVGAYAGATSTDITEGEGFFNQVGCNVCHVRSMTTGNHANAALRGQTVNLFSDLLVHDIGTGDGIQQGLANEFEFRTAPLWGAGQRLFFMHQGTATTLDQAVAAHGGTAATVVGKFNTELSEAQKRKVFKFIRSL